MGAGLTFRTPRPAGGNAEVTWVTPSEDVSTG